MRIGQTPYNTQQAKTLAEAPETAEAAEAAARDGAAEITETVETTGKVSATNQPAVSGKNTNIETLLHAFEMPDTLQNRELLRNMLSGGVAATKDNFVALSQILERFEGLTARQAIFMADEGIQINPQNIKQFQGFLEHRNLVGSQLENILKIIGEEQPQTVQASQTAQIPQTHDGTPQLPQSQAQQPQSAVVVENPAAMLEQAPATSQPQTTQADAPQVQTAQPQTVVPQGQAQQPPDTAQQPQTNAPQSTQPQVQAPQSQPAQPQTTAPYIPQQPQQTPQQVQAQPQTTQPPVSQQPQAPIIAQPHANAPQMSQAIQTPQTSQIMQPPQQPQQTPQQVQAQPQTTQPPVSQQPQAPIAAQPQAVAQQLVAAPTVQAVVFESVETPPEHAKTPEGTVLKDETKLPAGKENVTVKENAPSSEAEQADASERPEKIDKLISSLFKKVDPEHARRLPREMSAQTLVRELREAVEAVRQKMPEMSEKKRAVLGKAVAELEQNVEFLNKISEYTPVVNVPLQWGKERTTAELYVFNDSKNNKKIDPQNATVFVSLMTANAGRVETMIKVLGKNVECDFSLELPQTVNIALREMPGLSKLLDNQGYRLARSSAFPAEKAKDIFDVKDIRDEQKSRYFFDRTV